MDKHFGVRPGVKLLAAVFEISSQRFEVVDLPVRHNPHGLVFVVERLMAGYEVDDTQAPRSEANRPLEINALIIGAAVGHSVAHAKQYFLIDRPAGLEIQDARYRTHRYRRIT